MRKKAFIDALYAAGWSAPNDAQWTNIEKLWRTLFPSVAEVEDSLAEAIEEAHMAGQYRNGDGVDPSYSDAQSYRKTVLDQ